MTKLKSRAGVTAYLGTMTISRAPAVTAKHAPYWVRAGSGGAVVIKPSYLSKLRLSLELVGGDPLTILLTVDLSFSMELPHEAV